MLAVVVKNGTGAGRRIVREPRSAWECRCVEGRTTKHYRQHEASTIRCTACGTRRP